MSGPMKVLTLWQPHASLVALKVKWVETRPWTTRYRGALAIHAARQRPPAKALDPPLYRPGDLGPPHRLPLGAILATCTLADVVPIGRWATGQHVGDFPHDGPLPHHQGGLWLVGPGPVNNGTPLRIEDQRPYGDFTPGRYAWLLEDIEPLPEPVPFKGGQGLSRTWEP